ncbi:MAG: phosphate transport system regulatory protein PhoU [Candidatus Dadabacteria bacterium]|nr:MAG: phosphate transport system regulatory protein PhoU [Candidatus Dadabacteria bacterium]
MKPHTSRAYEADLERLQQQILRMGALVEQAIGDAMGALVDRDPERARAVIARDHEINRHEVEIDERCIELLALRQPAAGDLRLIITGLKISTDLERIGDLAVNMSERALELVAEPPLKPLIDLPRMAEAAQAMVRRSLDAYVNRDADAAKAVCESDDEVDRLNDQIFRELLTYMLENPANISRALGLILIARYLERIADHATNISEMVIYLVKGKDIRHTHVPEDAGAS